MNNTKKYHFVRCPICGCDCFNWIVSIKDKFGKWVNISICTNDGFVYLNPRWNRIDYEIFYKNEYDNLKRPKLQDNIEPSFKHAKQVWKRIAKNHTVKKINSVLDVGAGRGWILDYIKLKHQGIKTCAIEPSKECRKQIIERGHNVIDLNLDYYQPLSNKKFDLIIMRHVLEHLYNPGVALLNMKNLMHKNTILYIAVPNIDKMKRMNWFHSAHLYYFSNKTIRKLFSNMYLNVEASSIDSEIWYTIKKPDIDRYSEQQNKIMRCLNG